MQSSSTLIENIRAYPRSKKISQLIKDSENIFAYWKIQRRKEAEERTKEEKRGVGKQVCSRYNLGSGRQHNPSKQNCYVNKNISFP